MNGTENKTDQYISVPKAAGMLGVSPRTLGRILDAGEIEFIKPSVHRRVSLISLAAYRRNRRGGKATRLAPETENVLA